MSIPTTIPVLGQVCPDPDLSSWLETFDRREKLLALLSLSERIKGDNLETTIFSAIIDRLCDDDELFCALIVDAMYRKLSYKRCLKFLQRLNHRLASNMLEQLEKGGGHE